MDNVIALSAIVPASYRTESRDGANKKPSRRRVSERQRDLVIKTGLVRRRFCGACNESLHCAQSLDEKSLCARLCGRLEGVGAFR